MQIEQTTTEMEIQSQRKVAGFDKAIVTYRKLVNQSKNNLMSKRQEEFIAYVQRVVFNNGDDQVVTPPDLAIQEKVVARMKDL